MMHWGLVGGVFLGWSLGRNNLSTLFGTAIGTRMIQFRTAAVLAVVCLFLGALFSGQATTGNVARMADLKTVADALIICLTTGLMLVAVSRLGIPASIAQTSVGALVGWNLFHHQAVDVYLLGKTVSAWFVGPCLAALLSWGGIKLLRLIARRYPISMFRRDMVVRVGLVIAGMMAAYALGANNISTITGPYLTVLPLAPVQVIIVVCAAVAVGCFQADKRVIQTVSRSLFPLSPTESLLVMVTSALTMFLFSGQAVRDMMVAVGGPVFPLVPVPMTAVMIGGITGISLAKGGYGLRLPVLGQILLSWILVPVVAGLVCYGLSWMWGG